MAERPLLAISGLGVEFAQRHGPPLVAVDDVDLDIARGETVGLVGESGSGKSTIGRIVLGLTPATRGSVTFDSRDITHSSARSRRALSAELQVVFQDPFSSLNPARTIASTLSEPLLAHERLSSEATRERVTAMLERVGLPPEAASRYPRQFSGGQRQRIAIARALMLSPRLVICDEPVSALDLSVQAQILNLLRELQIQHDLAYLFIAHDLSVVRYLSHRIVVLYQGRVMETGTAESVYANPAHPYTRNLLAAAPVPDPVRQRARTKSWQVPAGRDIAAPGADACPFAPRCRHVIDKCWHERPSRVPTETGYATCHRVGEIDGDGAEINGDGAVIQG
jgi:oligopeptide/dipeptide ABC transporter ATP-binding protein